MSCHAYLEALLVAFDWCACFSSLCLSRPLKPIMQHEVNNERFVTRLRLHCRIYYYSLLYMQYTSFFAKTINIHKCLHLYSRYATITSPNFCLILWNEQMIKAMWCSLLGTISQQWGKFDEICWVHTGRFFFKKNITYLIWTRRDLISLILQTQFSLILGTRRWFSLILGVLFSVLRTQIESLKHL